MTETTITDRALDAWLAEHLFIVEGGSRQPDGSWTTFRRGSRVDEVPSPTSTGDGMLLVLEAMRERGWYGSASFIAPIYGGECMAQFSRHNPHEGYAEDGRPCVIANDIVSVTAPSLPRAVALAAKTALEASA